MAERQREIPVVGAWLVLSHLRAASSTRGKAVAVLGLWALAFASKLVVLELVSLVFGDRVSLGGFVSVTVLVVALLLARGGVRRLPGER